jgi:Carboxypeptidase regulatory-like domain
MHASGTRFTVLLVLALMAGGAPARAAAQVSPNGPFGGVRGTAVDASDGVLPGVTVTAIGVDGRSLDTTVTDGSGAFSFDRLPDGPVDLSFHLDGFEDARTHVTIQPGGPGDRAGALPIRQRLELLARTETVTVRADPPPSPPRPRPLLVPVADHDQASVCGPAKAEVSEPFLGTIRSRRDEAQQGLFAAGDELLIDGGTVNGLAVGQNFVARRLYPTGETSGRSVPVMGEHSSGLVQIVSVEAQTSVAVVVYACDEIMTGDYLAAFEPEPVRVPDPVGTPAFDKAARILFADVGQLLGVPRRMMVIDRGTRDGVQPGQRFTLFRPSRFGRATPTIVGQAVVVAVRARSATIRIEEATDVIVSGAGGDWAAPQRPTLRAAN